MKMISEVVLPGVICDAGEEQVNRFRFPVLFSYWPKPHFTVKTLKSS